MTMLPQTQSCAFVCFPCKIRPPYFGFALAIFFSFSSKRSLLSSAPRRRATETKSSASFGRGLLFVVDFGFGEVFALDCDFIGGVSLGFERQNALRGFRRQRKIR